MKYIEELEFGDCFFYKNELFILTNDFGSNSKHKCISIQDGSSRWFKEDSTVQQQEIYILDNENNISPVKIRKPTTI